MTKAELVSQCFQEAYSLYVEIEDEQGFAITGDEYSQVLLIQFMLETCSLRFIADILHYKSLSIGLTEITGEFRELSNIEDVIHNVHPRQYLEPDLQRRSISDEYVFFLILNDALQTYKTLFPQADRMKEIIDLQNSVAIILNYKYFAHITSEQSNP